MSPKQSDVYVNIANDWTEGTTIQAGSLEVQNSYEDHLIQEKYKKALAAQNANMQPVENEEEVSP